MNFPAVTVYVAKHIIIQLPCIVSCVKVAERGAQLRKNVLVLIKRPLITLKTGDAGSANRQRVIWSEIVQPRGENKTKNSNELGSLSRKFRKLR